MILTNVKKLIMLMISHNNYQQWLKKVGKELLQNEQCYFQNRPAGPPLGAARTCVGDPCTRECISTCVWERLPVCGCPIFSFGKNVCIKWFHLNNVRLYTMYAHSCTFTTHAHKLCILPTQTHVNTRWVCVSDWASGCSAVPVVSANGIAAWVLGGT